MRACRAARRSQAPMPAPSSRSTVTTWPAFASTSSSRPSRSRSSTSLRSTVPAAVSAMSSAAIRWAQGRDAHVGDVDAAEKAVPVAVVRLAAVQVVERCNPRSRPGAIAGDPGGDAEHLLVQVVDLAVARLEVPPERAAQPARLGRAGVASVMERRGERARLVRRERPLAHLRVRAGRDVDPPERRVRRQPVARADRRQPVGVRLDRLEEPVDPATLAPAVLLRRWPRPELLAVVAHHAHALARHRWRARGGSR